MDVDLDFSIKCNGYHVNFFVMSIVKKISLKIKLFCVYFVDVKTEMKSWALRATFLIDVEMF